MSRVLLIKDNRGLAATVWDYLELLGFGVDCAHDGIIADYPGATAEQL